MDHTPPDGAGVAGNFLGLESPFSDYTSARYCVIPAPFGKTTSYGKGTERGPAALIESSRYVEFYDCETDSEPFRDGIYTCEPVPAASSEQVLAALESKVTEVLRDSKLPIMIGGEHSLSAAPMRALANVHSDFSVLQFDAHADLRHAYEGNLLSHASVMARAKEIPQLRNIVAVGLRAIDIEERDAGVREDMFFDHELRGNWAERALARLQSDNVYISFDVDAFGTELMPSTGTPEPGGINWFQALEMLRLVCERKTIIGFDVVELAPIEHLPAPDFLAAKLVYKIMAYMSKTQRW
jgi:agmatinase